jgi:hypothetical protein
MDGPLKADHDGRRGGAFNMIESHKENHALALPHEPKDARLDHGDR